jgi:hypothetical protein
MMVIYWKRTPHVFGLSDIDARIALSDFLLIRVFRRHIRLLITRMKAALHLQTLFHAAGHQNSILKRSKGGVGLHVHVP